MEHFTHGQVTGNLVLVCSSKQEDRLSFTLVMLTVAILPGSEMLPPFYPSHADRAI